MKDFLRYQILYPDLPIEISMFFSQTDLNNGRNVARNVFSFCSYFTEKYKTSTFISPRVIANICDILVDNGKLSVANRGGFESSHNSYIAILNPEILNDSYGKSILNKHLSYLIYGFKYVYEDYRKYVLPIEYTDYNDDKSLGTCFLFRTGIATAKHCIEGAKNISIQGILKEHLKKAKFEIHENEAMDLLFIRFENPLNDTILFSENAEMLDEVMTMGYPKIPGYHNFLAAENATVSARFTVSIGQIASNAEDIWIREKLFLITAKIKGGNSGGPVVNRNGYVVGVSVNLSKGEGDYDDLGYGTVIPVSFLDELFEREDRNYLDVSKIEFKDFDIC